MIRSAVMGHRRAGLVVASLLLVAAVTDGGAGTAEPKPSVEALTAFFESVVFESEYKGTFQASKMITKWAGPIRVFVSAMVGKILPTAGGGRELKLEKTRPKKTHVQAIQRHLNRLVKLTGLKTEDSKKAGKRPNLLIKFVPRLAMHAPFLFEDREVGPRALKRLAMSGPCYFVTESKGGAISWGIIIANIEMTDQQVANRLLEEMTQALGLPNDSDMVKPSVFNQLSELPELTRSDQILIRALYDKRLRTGTSRAEAMARVGAVIAELDATSP